jgi:hypothetical protein
VELMPKSIPVYLEVGSKRIFAAAVDWPGWCRAGRDEDDALQALVAYGQRYVRAMGPAARALHPPNEASGLKVVERLKGNATTEFGAPGTPPSSDAEPVARADLTRLETFLTACWAAFDSATRKASSAVLSKGPRGGGRDLDAIVDHVLGADAAYLSGLGGTYRAPAGAKAMQQMRHDFLEILRARAGGEVPVLSSRRRSPLWTPRYAVRRSAWHALDHAWEIEDRASQ